MRLDIRYTKTDSPAFDIENHPYLFTDQRREELSRRPLACQRESVAGRLLLKELLRERGVELPLPMHMTYGEWDKPMLLDAPHLHFNISHSDGWAVCALCEAEVGVDIQSVRSVRPSIARRFAPSERAMLEALPEGERNRALCRLWTLKEAWCKCTGEGLSAPLDSAVFTLEPLSIDKEGFQVACLEGPEGFELSVCVYSPQSSVLSPQIGVAEFD